MSLSLNEINQALKPYRDEVHQQLILEQNISALQHQLASHKENLKFLDIALAKEWADVEALSSKWRHLWVKYMEGPDFELQKEQKEWEMVRDERESLINLIAQIQEQIKALEAKRQYLGELNTPLKDLLSAKHEILMASPTHDVYQGMAAKEQTAQAEVQLLEKLVADFIILIDHQQRLEVLLQTSSKGTNNYRSITYYLDNANNLLEELATRLLQAELEIDLDPTVLQGFESQLNGSYKPQDWVKHLDSYQGNAQLFLTRLQAMETQLSPKLAMLRERRQKFLYESY